MSFRFFLFFLVLWHGLNLENGEYLKRRKMKRKNHKISSNQTYNHTVCFLNKFLWGKVITFVVQNNFFCLFLHWEEKKNHTQDDTKNKKTKKENFIKWKLCVKCISNNEKQTYFKLKINNLTWMKVFCNIYPWKDGKKGKKSLILQQFTKIR